jgi:hypothetical protein
MTERRITYAVEQRLRMIDFLLANFGFVRRSHIEDYFGITTAQVSTDISLYQELAPGNIAYDLSGKAYRVTAAFIRLYP